MNKNENAEGNGASKGGCCGGGHTGHNQAGHSHHDHEADSAATGRDPVCGMTVNPATSKHRFDYKGDTYHFCSAACRTKFAADPVAFKRETALELGATHAADPAGDDVTGLLRELTDGRGADYAFDTAGAPGVVAQAYDAAHPRAKRKA